MIDTVKANEGVVSTIGDTDLVMVCTLGGDLRPISFENLAKLVRDSIRIDGCNLIRNSCKEISGTSISYYFAHDLEVGEEYAFTVCVNLPSAVQRLVVSPYGGNFYNTKEFKNLEAGEHILSGVLKPTRVNIAFRFSVYAYVETSKVLSITCNWCTLVKGNVPSSWSPAPEDLRGGVIGLFPITYNSVEKGGAHDGHDNIGRSLEGGADGLLCFGSLDALAQFVGRACEDGGNACGEELSEYLGYTHRSGLDCREIGFLIQYNPELSRKGVGVDTDHFPTISDNLESRKWRRNLFPDSCGYKLAELEKSLDGEYVDRKEVAHV